MNTSIRPTQVRFDEGSFWVELSNGRVLGVPLTWFPRLLNATQQQREQLRLSTSGLHWEALNGDISVAGLLAGLSDRSNHQKSSAA